MSGRTISLATLVRSAAGAAAFVIGTAVAAAAAPHAGDVAPAFAVPRTNGGTFSSISLRGKAAYLNFFASWCGPCNEEAPDVARLYAKYRSRKLSMVGIDEQEDASKAKGFAAKYRWPFPIVVDGGDMARDYGAVGLPVHVFIGRDGKVSTYRLGEMSTPDIEAALRKILQ